MKLWRLKELTFKSVKKAKYEVAVLPIGSTEPHNFHLPYGTDFLTVEAIAEKICGKASKNGAKVILLPTMPFSTNSNFARFPLAINVNPSTYLKFVENIVESMEKSGIFKFVILNGHGGNDFYPIVRELYGKTRVFISAIDYWKTIDDLREEIFEHSGQHADEFETSLCMELFPELVYLEDADDGTIKTSRLEALNKGWAKIAKPWHLLTKNSGHGNPRKASPEKGKKCLEVIVERLSKYILELSEASMDKTFPY